jgi:hypothetical protein
MRDWDLMLSLHWPHDRLALGWEYLRPTPNDKWHTIQIFLFMATFTLNIESHA